MKSSNFPSQVCSVARTLEIVGEWWTLLIIREAFFGSRRFGEFEAQLGIAKNVLSDRLAKLLDAGILERRSLVGRGNPGDYLLTAKGRDLFPAVVALMQWGDRWVYGEERAPVRVLERATREEIVRVRVTGRGGQALELRDVVTAPGPGATEAIRRRIGDGFEAS